MRSVTLGTKVFVLLALALVLCGVTAAAGLSAASSLNRIVDDYQRRKLPALDALAGIATHVAEATGAAAAVENQDADEAAHGVALKSLHVAVLQARDGAKAFDGLEKSEEESRSWALTSKLLDEWEGSVDTIAKAAKERAAQAEDFAKAAAAQHEVSAGFNSFCRAEQTLVAGLAHTARLTHEAAAQLSDQASRTQRAARNWLIAVFALAGAVLLAGGWFLAAGTRRTLSTLKAEAARLRDAVAAGRIEVRAETAGVADEFRPIVAGMNETMEAFERPLRMTADHVARIGRGDIPEPITDRYEGDFDLIKESLNGCIAAVGALVKDAQLLARAGVEGRLETRADASRHQGDFRKVVQGVNDTLDAVVGPLRVAAETVGSLAHGKMPPRIDADYRGEFAVIRDNLNLCIDSVNRLVADANALAEAGAAGRLSTRADASNHHGDFRRIVEGVNRTLDAVVGPLDVAASTVAELAAGRVPPPIAQTFQGDFARVKDNLNTCFSAVNRLVEDAAGLVKAVTAGQLSKRADSGAHQGDFARIVGGVNETLDAVTAPVREATAVLERLASKDLVARVSGEYEGDHARIKKALNATAGSLQEALTQVARAVEQVSGAASQIASSSQAVASGASEQARSLAEITAAIESVSGTAAHSADSAQQANTLAAEARSAAGAGASAVEALQQAMIQIRQSADRTGQIIKDVSDIAFQTNLLALNAAVEAARAGEAGRGFAVVAEEVRSLALRAKEAAQKTEELIRESVKQASEGEAAGAQVSGRLKEIFQGVSKVSDIVAEISASAREQTTGIARINSALGEMDRVTEQNAASAEESSSAASELNAQAEDLASMVSTFTLDEGRRTQRLTPPRRNLPVKAVPRTAREPS